MSVYRRGKTWSYSIEVGRDADGRRRRVYAHGFGTKRAASDAQAKARTELRGGTHVDRSKLTVGQFLRQEWLPYKRPSSLVRRDVADELGQELEVTDLSAVAEAEVDDPGRVRPSTFRDYEMSCRLHIEPAIGGVRLQDLRAKHIEDLLRAVRAKGLSPKTVFNIYGVIHRALEDAKIWQLIPINPCDGVPRPSKGRSQFDRWDLAEVRRFLHALQDHPYSAAFLLLVSTGMRRGELAGLTWDNVDLDRGLITVRWTLTNPGGKWAWGPAKTNKGSRTFAIDPVTVAGLREYKARQAAWRLAAGPAWVTSNADSFGRAMRGMVFTHANGTAISPNRWRLWLREICASAGLRYIPVHAIRHTYATHALQAATSLADMKQLSDRLGHSTMTFTLDKYAAFLPDSDRKLAEDIAQLWHAEEGTVEDLRDAKRRRDERTAEDGDGPT